VAKKDGQFMSRMEMNGRIVVPKDILKATGAKLGTRFIWELMEDGSIRVSAKCKRPAEADDRSSTMTDECTNQ
jgi:bifunctional DNA-binding transcriptional regulator/antitoxin component of YhaV-PrlF toxin-antitoxin module